MTEPTADVVRTLRGDILAHGLSDWVSLADLRGQDLIRLCDQLRSNAERVFGLGP